MSLSRVPFGRYAQRGRPATLLLMLAAALVVACAPTATPAKPADAPKAAESKPAAPAAPAAAASPAAAGAASPVAAAIKPGGSVKVGILHSLSGTMAISETSVRDAEIMAIEEINAKGGVLGKKIVPIIEDGASDWPTFAEKARKLIQRTRW